MTSRNLWISKTFFVFAAILITAPLWAQNSNSPLDTMFGIYFAPDTATVERYLLKSTCDQLAKLDPETRQGFLSALMLARRFERDGFISTRVTSGKTVLEIQPKDEKPLRVSVDVQMVSGDDALIWSTVTMEGQGPMPVVAYLKQEDGRWRLARVTFEDSPMNPFSRLDSPGFAEGLGKARLEANQASAVGCLRTLNTAEVVYSSTYTHGFSPDIKSLDGAGSGTPSEGAAGLIDEILGSGKKAGYVFTYTPGGKDSSGSISSYTITAQPIEFGQTGTINFFTDQSGVIRQTKENRPATVNDPPLS